MTSIIPEAPTSYNAQLKFVEITTMSLDDDFDEDYIPMSHPLYSYMQEVGIERDEKEIINFCEASEAEEIIHLEVQKEDMSPIKKVANLYLELKSSLLTFILGTIFTHVKRSGILTEEDDRFLIFHLENPKVETSFGEFREKIFSDKAIKKLFFCASVVLAILLYLLCTCEGYLSTLVIGGIFALFMVPFGQISRDFWKMRLLCSQMSHLLTTAVNYDRSMRRSILFIQEMEVVARGFTFVSNQGVLSGLETTKQSHKERQCPLFRRQLFIQMRRYVHALRWMTRDLIKAFPESNSHDTIHCIAEMDVKEFGPSLSLPETSLDDLARVTQEFAIPLLKGMHQFSGFHISELLRKLCIIATTMKSKKDFDSLNTRIGRWEALIRSQQSQCQRFYEQSRVCLPPSSSDISETSAQLEKAGNSQAEKSGLYTSVHSMSLHLQSVLYRVRRLEDSLEPFAAGQRPSSVHGMSKLQSDLGSLKGELDACLICWEEAMRQSSNSDAVDKPSASPIPASAVTGADQVASAEQQTRRAEVWLIGDPIIEDEVLEAYVESEEEEEVEMGGCHGDDWSLIGTAAEARERRKREKEQSKRMLGELQSVISTRARQWKKRERRALKRQQGDNCDSSDSEPVDDNSDSIAYNNETTGTVEDETACVLAANNDSSVQRRGLPSRLSSTDLPAKLSADEEAQVRQRVRQLPTGFQLELTSALAAQVVSRRSEMFQQGGGGSMGVLDGGAMEECFGDDVSDSSSHSG